MLKQILAYDVLDNEKDLMCNVRIMEDSYLVIETLNMQEPSLLKLHFNNSVKNIRSLANALNYIADEREKYGEDDLIISLDDENEDDNKCDCGCHNIETGISRCYCDCDDDCEDEEDEDDDDKIVNELEQISARLDKIEQKIK